MNLVLVKARYPSYMDDIRVSISSKSTEDNCKFLSKIAKWIFEKGESNYI